MSLPEREHSRLTERFLEAAALEGDARRALLERVRHDDPLLGAELESLLRHDGDPHPFVGTLGAERAAGMDLPPGARLGPYTVLRRLGEGGMGVVYLAAQHAPVRREVAIKLIRSGYETGQVLARFEAERHALERLDHPHVARVLDAGVAEDGRPYVVLEHVPGEPITGFADRHALDVDARLRLFVLVCDAVHHAHQNAVLHRDIKPSNVLVGMVDGTPVPKVIDFGVAKALTRAAGEAPTLTEAGQLLGTPAYMSPEQARSPAEGVDIRADVYSLGCLLHELLVGRPPLDPEVLRRLGPEAIRRLVLEDDPSPPSLRLAGLGEAAREVAARRRTDRRALVRRLRADLDWIVARAIARDRSLRYASASELGADVRRHLGGEPVEARPPSAAYRLRKLTLRHRAAAAALAVAAPLIVAFAAAMAVQAHRVALERDRAEEVSELLLRFHASPFTVTTRHGPRDPGQLLRSGLEEARRQLDGQPVLQARVEHALGEAFRAVGDAGLAISVLGGAHARLVRLVGPDHPAALAAGHDLARAERDAGRLAEAGARFRSVLEARRRVLGPRHVDTLRTLAEWGILHKEAGRNAEAAAMLDEARTGLAAALGPRHRDAVLVTALLGSVELDLRRLDRAFTWLDESLASLAPGDPERGMALYNLACVHALRGERAEALDRLRAAAATGFSGMAYADPNFAPLHWDPEFEALVRRARSRNPRVVADAVAEAETLVRSGRTATAEALYRDLMEVVEPGPRAGIRYRLGALYVREGRYAEARPILLDDVAHHEKLYGRDSPSVGSHCLELAQVHLGCGDVPAALATLDRARRIFEEDRGLGRRSLVLYAQACREAILGDRPEALRFLEASVDAGLEDIERVEGDLALRSLRGEPHFRELVERMRRRYGPPRPLPALLAPRPPTASPSR